MMGGLLFLHPWILLGLAALPALWYLLRVTPPPPRLIDFPPARFLAGLVSGETTASRTPWWILLLRLLCLALIIVGLAAPVLHPAAALPGHGPVRLVVDDGWAAAQGWTTTIDTAEDIARRAARDDRPVYLLTTAPPPGGGPIAQQGPFAPGAALAALQGLALHPWPSDYAAAAKAARDAPVRSDLSSFWLTTGLEDGPAGDFAALLQDQGGLIAYAPPTGRLPILLRPAPVAGAALKAQAATVETKLPADLQLQAAGTGGRALGAATFDSDEVATLDLPTALRGEVQQLRLAGRGGAGAVLLLDDRFRRRVVGIAAATGDSGAHLTDAAFYLRAALSPTADIVTGPVTTLLARKPAVIVLPDVGALPADELDALDKWVRGGGLLLRFAGPNMTQGEQFLLPVALHAGDRATGGAMSWAKPQALAPFPVASPFYGLAVPPDITVSRQLLAEPAPGLAQLTWATLSDGTPLVTAKPLDRGLLVLVHTTATPQWSNFALSGLFVQMLQRTVAMAGEAAAPAANAGGMLQPRLVLDGFGRLQPPPSWVQPLPAQDADVAAITARHPPGYYGQGGQQVALNLGASLPALSRLSLPEGTEQRFYGGGAREVDLTPRLLLAAFILFLLDWLAMIGLRTGARLALALAMILLALALPVQTQAADPDAIKYAGDLYLAYVRTGDAAIDAQSEQGLTALAAVLRQRTATDPAGVAAVDPASDELSFFPLLYWPVAANAAPLPPEAQRRVQYYLDHGGTILFDTHDQGQAGDGKALQALTAGLDIPPLAPMPPNHVLTKSFYLLRNFPVRYDEGDVWVEETSNAGRDGVSSVIVANHGWGVAWAADGDAGEMDRRFGVNLVLYALTGNYKNDQIHLAHILERLGQ